MNAGGGVSTIDEGAVDQGQMRAGQKVEQPGAAVGVPRVGEHPPVGLHPEAIGLHRVSDPAGGDREGSHGQHQAIVEVTDGIDLVGEVLVGQLGTSLQDSERSPIDQAISSLDRYLDAIATHRAFARLFVVEAHAAGPRALLRRAELQAVVVDALVDLLAARDANARFACEAFVAAVSALVTLPLATGDVDALRALRNPLVGRLRALADETSR